MIIERHIILQIIKATYYQGTFNLRCNDATSRLDTSESATHQVNASYMYFLLKLLDLLDTVRYKRSDLPEEEDEEVLAYLQAFYLY